MITFISSSPQQGGQTQTLTLQPAQPPQGQADGQNQTAVVAQSGQQGQQQQQQFLQVSVEGSRYHTFKRDSFGIQVLHSNVLL